MVCVSEPTPTFDTHSVAPRNEGNGAQSPARRVVSQGHGRGGPESGGFAQDTRVTDALQFAKRGIAVLQEIRDILKALIRTILGTFDTPQMPQPVPHLGQ